MLALIVALVGPLFVDWTSYRAAFEREAGLVLGQPVRVLGSADMQLLPMPRLQFESVHVGEDAKSPVLVVDAFDVGIELFPLLQGEIDVVDMTLKSPKMQVQFDENGRFIWPAIDPKRDLKPDQIRLRDVRIQDGRIRFEDQKSGRSGVVDHINGTLEARSLIGPYKIESAFQFEGNPYSLMMSSGSANGAGIRLKSLLTPANLPVTLSMDGMLEKGEDGRLHYRADTQLNNLVDGGDGKQLPWSLSGKSDLTIAALVMPSFEFSHGQADQAYRLTGAGRIDFGTDPRFDLVVSSRQLDLDRSLGQGPNAPVNLKDGVHYLTDLLVTMPAPPMPGHVGFDVPGIIMGGGIVRDFRFDALWANESWRINRLEALLPGQSALALSGVFAKRQSVQKAGDGHVFEGEVRLKSDQPSAFAKWWLKDVPNVGRLEPFDLSGQLLSKNDQLVLDALDLDLDGDRASGRIDWYRPKKAGDTSGGALAVQLKAEGLDLDVVQGIGSLLLANSAGNAAPLGDIKLDIETDQLSMGDFEGRALSAKLRLAKGVVDIERLIVEDFAGAHLNVTGSLQDLAAKPRGALEGQVKAQSLAGLAGLTQRLLPDRAFSRWLVETQTALSPADLSFAVEGKGQEEGLTLALNGMVGGGSVDLDGRLAGTPNDWYTKPVKLDAKIANDQGSKLMALVGMGNHIVALPRLEAKVVLDGVLSDGASLSIDVQPQDGQLTFKGTAAYSDTGGWRANGPVSLQSSDVAPYLLGAGIVLSDAASAVPAELSAKLDYAAGLSRLADVKGSWDGQPVAGAVSLETTLTDHVLRGQLGLGDLDGIWLGETVLGAGRLTNVDRQWRDVAFLSPQSSAGALPLKLDLEIKARSLELGAPYIFQNPNFKLVWRNNSLYLNDFSGLLAGGKVTGGFQIENLSGEAVVKSHVAVEGTDLSPFIWLRDGRAVATGLLDMKATLEAQGRSLAGLVSGLSGDGAFTLKDGTVRYVNAQAFEQVVRAVDAGLELKDKDIARTFLAHMDAGSTMVNKMDGTFRIAGGALRASNIEADVPILQSRGNLTLDLAGQSLLSDWSIKIEPAEEDAVTGAQPEVGLVFSGDLAAPKRVVDVAPFTGYLSIRAFEKEVERVENLQADILEKERMRRLLKLYRQQEKRREAERLAAEKAAEDARIAAEEAKKRAIEEEKLRKREEARLKAERLAAEKRAKQEREAAARRAALEAKKKKQEAERLAKEAARKAAEVEAKRKKEAEEAAKLEAQRLAEIARVEKAQQALRKKLETLRQEIKPDISGDQVAPVQGEQSAGDIEGNGQIAPNAGQADGIEVKPLGDLSGGASEGRAGQTIEPQQSVVETPVVEQSKPETEAVVPEETFITLPPELKILPKKRAVRPLAPLSIVPPAQQPAAHNDLINELRRSPDLIIQLD